MRFVPLVIASLLTVALAARAQDLAALQAFEAATIKRTINPIPNGTSFGGGSPGRWVMTNGPARALILSAYPSATSELINAPSWVLDEYYDVIAIGAGIAARDREQAMLRTLLADRFKLKVHYEPREQPAYALVPARADGRLGATLRRVEADCATYTQARREKRPVPDVKPPENGSPLCSMSMGRGVYVSGGRTMAELAASLGGFVDRVVVDRTNLPGDYEFQLTYSSAPDAPSIFTTIQEQLGLKLEPVRVPIDVIVIDHIERPTPD